MHVVRIMPVLVPLIFLPLNLHVSFPRRVYFGSPPISPCVIQHFPLAMPFDVAQLGRVLNERMPLLGKEETQIARQLEAKPELRRSHCWDLVTFCKIVCSLYANLAISLSRSASFSTVSAGTYNVRIDMVVRAVVSKHRRKQRFSGKTRNPNVQCGQ